MDRPLEYVKDFLTLKLIPGKRLLLALSGGNDSLALLYVLLECRKLFDFTLHIAHVDHGWREESASEAKLLGRMIKELQLSFHQRRLIPLIGSNLEDRYRKKRYAFFHELQEEWDFQAVILAHHADDQGETLLKRICEGARLGALGGLQPEVRLGKLKLWRPLLSIRKKELTHFLQVRQLKPFDDWTNRDIHYLRSRMRVKIFPGFEKEFGKNIGRNFHRLGCLFQDIKGYLEEKRKKIENTFVQGPFGAYLRNPQKYPRLEMRYLLEEKTRMLGVHLSHDSCDTLLRLIQMNASKATICAGPLSFVINKNILFFFDRKFPIFNWEQWVEKNEQSTWKDFWRGFCSRMPPKSEAVFLDGLTPILRKKIKKWYVSNGVPSFFHDKAPIFCIKGKVISECLTGRCITNYE